ncbi:Galactose mutarotase [Pseudolycoriella hygida]|uniref:Galactose mutarotase n=1 Tax=Pseudolycoriella hygida TaxID=35572 RepID=A0A9Q0RVG2_9DIPT|nr:Galactose mutarotase [Pseudolycoriella hygida]
MDNGIKDKADDDISSNSKLEPGNTESDENISKETEIPLISHEEVSPAQLVGRTESMAEDSMQIIKETSLTVKVSKNVLEESGKIVGDISIALDGFGMVTTDKGTEVVKRFTFTNIKNKMQIQVISLGATITSIQLPDKNGVLEDVALGFDTIEEYYEDSNPSIGCTLGRDAFETLQDEHYSGLGLFNWISSLDGSKLVLSHVSEDGWKGYRGTVMIKAIFELKEDNSFHVTYRATSTRATSINLSLNLYLNLAGHAAKRNELYKHIFTINADKSIKDRTYKLSKFQPKYVGGTVFDLRSPKEIGPVIARSPQFGFDKYYILTKGTEQLISFAARVLHPTSGRYVEIYTDQGGIQFYTADYFPDVSNEAIPMAMDDSFDRDTVDLELTGKSDHSLKSGVLYSRGGEIKGKDGASYERHGAFCINSLGLPAEDIGNNFKNNIVIPSYDYQHRIIYKFGVVD